MKLDSIYVTNILEAPICTIDTYTICMFYVYLRAGSHGVPSPKSLISTSPNIEAKYQLLDLKKPLKYGSYPLKSDFDYCMQKNLTTCVASWVLVFKFNPTLNTSS